MVDRPVWIGVFHVPASALFHGCPMRLGGTATPAPPEPPNDFYFAIIMDPSRGTQGFWTGDASAYIQWACATGHGNL